ncbi:MAG: decarboxylating 6-phosphogluconate dehydrogenase [Actinomycetota bacterium]|nr:decarboxylating 6-phosphogluconate dehydrogenase [Actinomycetota bacterium]
MKLGMIGLGRMGANMSTRLERAGHEVIGYDRDPGVSEVPTLAALVDCLDGGPRVVWSMVPAGDPTEATIAELADLLGEGDVVVDGGNSNYHDSMRRGESLATKGIGFVDAGVSGGVWGLEEGYCLMVGGSGEHVAAARPAFDALSPDEGGYAHVGPVGAGHFTKMVHNGIEYGLMHAYAEGYELLNAADIDVDVDAVVEAWRHGSVVRSWLLDLLCLAVEADPGLASIAGRAHDSGEGRWTVNEAVRLSVPLPVISAALFARFSSRQLDSPAMKVVAALREQFGGHTTESIEQRPSEAGGEARVHGA